MRALEGIRVLDLTRLLPGAITTLFMAEMGAEVIKVEDPNGGDYARWTPPLLDGVGAFFRVSNRYKKSIIVDLKRPEGQAILHRLVTTADVLIEGFRPGVAMRLGVDYATLRDIHPRLVYCSLSGWGATGDYATMSGHDLNYVALSGVLGAGAHTRAPGGQIADVGGAYACLSAVMAGLLQCGRTGAGTYIDTALFEASMPFAMYQFTESVIGAAQAGAGSLTGGMAYYDVYMSADGKAMAFAPIESKFWENFCRAIDKPEWIARHQDDQQALKSELVALFAGRTLEAWQTVLSEADCCWTPVTDPADLIHDPHIQARGMAGVDEDGVPFMRSPIHLMATPGEMQRAPLSGAPSYGEHTVTILKSIGYDDAELEAWMAQGVIKAP